jgi:hypothetical protein
MPFLQTPLYGGYQPQQQGAPYGGNPYAAPGDPYAQAYFNPFGGQNLLQNNWQASRG